MILHLSLILLFLMFLLLTIFMSSGFHTLEYDFMSLSYISLSFNLKSDKMSVMFFFVITTVFMMIYTYSMNYLSKDSSKSRFLWLLLSFYLSMGIFVFGGNLFSSMIGWDLLGVTSTLLILYFSSNSSAKAGLLTFLSNRIGDCFFILSMTLMVVSECFYNADFFMLQMFTFMVSLTKSAQVPFSSWLPAAMEAPTPVSALVHSSTLVTAGVYLMMRYFFLWEKSQYVMCCMLISSSITVLLASSCSLIEMDIKKVIALSTLSQMGFIMMTLSLNMKMQAFFHLLMHAFFKSLIFLIVGILIHDAAGSQDIRRLSHSFSSSSMMSFILVYSLLMMAGLPFASGFFSKDLILDSFLHVNYSILINIFIFLSFIMTSMYCGRLVHFLFKSSSSLLSESDSVSFILPFVSLFSMSMMSGSCYTWIELPSFLGQSSKIFLILILFSAFVGSVFYKFDSESYFLASKWNLTVFNKYFSFNFFITGFKMYINISDTGFGGVSHLYFMKHITFMSKTYSMSQTYITVTMEIFMLIVMIYFLSMF